MSWYPKEQPTPFDDQPIPGLMFLDGDMLARALMQSWTREQKLPLIEFPSGQQCQVWESRDADNPIVHIFGEMDLRLRQTRDEALVAAQYIAEQVGYNVEAVGDDSIRVRGFDRDEQFILKFDNQGRRLLDVVQTKDKPALHPAHNLMPDDLREKLPMLGTLSNSSLADMTAQVKYFTPDSNWTWYGAEFDGEIFYGLVDGFELEFGYFTLSELQELRGPMGLRVERDLYYEPKSLAELQQQHRRQRGE